MSSREITQVVTAQEALEGAGVRIRRSLGVPELDYHDPFLLLDEFKSEQGSDYIAGFPDHPHRGFETVTYMLAGSMRHEDHRGNRGELGPGGVQWMTAGRGIIHSEMPLQEDGLMWGFQLWVNLPAADKMTEPRYQDIDAARIRSVELDGGARAKVIAGTALSVRGPVEGIATSPLYLDVEVPRESDTTIPIPSEHSGLVYVYEGEGAVGSTQLASGQLGVLSRRDREEVRLVTTERPMRALVLAAMPLNEPMERYGPFVMNTREQIRQAFEDYKSGNFLG